ERHAERPPVLVLPDGHHLGQEVRFEPPAAHLLTRLRRASSPVARSRTLGATDLARLLGRHRADRHRHGAARLLSSTDAVRRMRLARDVLHDRNGALTHERDRHRLGTRAVARDTAPNPIATEPLRLLRRKLKDRRRWARNRAN